MSLKPSINHYDYGFIKFTKCFFFLVKLILVVIFSEQNEQNKTNVLKIKKRRLTTFFFGKPSKNKLKLSTSQRAASKITPTKVGSKITFCQWQRGILEATFAGGTLEAAHPVLLFTFFFGKQLKNNFFFGFTYITRLPYVPFYLYFTCSLLLSYGSIVNTAPEGRKG